MTFYSTLEKYHYQMKEGRFVMEVTASKVKVLDSYRFFSKCVQVHWHKSPVPSTWIIIACVVGYMHYCLCRGCAHWKGLLEEYSVSLLLHFIFYVVVSSSYKVSPSIVCPIVPFFPPFFSLFWFGFVYFCCVFFFFLTDLFLGKSFVSWLAARVFVCVFRSFVWGLVG